MKQRILLAFALSLGLTSASWAGPVLVFADGFESGDTSLWSSTAPAPCDPGYASAFVFTQGNGTGVRPIDAHGTDWVAFDNDFTNHQIRATNESADVDLQMEIWYPDESFAGCPPADYSHDDVGTGMGLQEVHDTGDGDVDPIPNGTVWIRITNLSSSAGSYSVFDSD